MRKALLIGSQTFGLQGVHYDLDLIGGALDTLNFSITSYRGEHASRQGILTAWSILIEQAEAQDAVVIYFSGHGGRVLNPQWLEGSTHARYLQFLVPTDMEQSRPGDFRGILSLELAQLLDQLTQRCRNVTVLLDCCHSSRLVRSSRSRARSLPDIWEQGIAEHLEQFQTQNGQLRFESNPHAVRLTASGAGQSAYEDPGGALGGYFTEALVDALSQVGNTEVSWEVLGRWVREQVLVMEPRQRPELEGPAQRLLFSQETAASKDRSGVLSFFYDGDDQFPSLRGGHIHGVVKDNLYAISDLESHKQSRIATAKVTEVLTGVSRVEIDGEEPLDGAIAKPLRMIVPKRKVGIERDVPQPVRRLLQDSNLFEPVEGGIRCEMARLRAVRGGLVVSDETGSAICHPTRNIGAVMTYLNWLARALTLRELGESDHALLDKPFSLEWGKVMNGKPQPLPSTAVLNSGERIYVTITNKSDAVLFANLFDIGISRRITLLNDIARSGYELAPGESWCFGALPDSNLIGVAPGWPSETPADGPRLETIVAIISNRPQDLSVLETGDPPNRSAASSSLERQIAARCLGGRRSGFFEDDEALGYAIRYIDFELCPQS